MTRITGEIVTGAPADVVSGFVAGQRNEPACNPHGQGSSGTWSPPSTRRAPAPGSSAAPHPPRLRAGTAASRPARAGRARRC